MSDVVLNDQNFDSEVLQSDQPVLVDFWAPWCGPCRMIAPMIEKLAGEFAGKIKIGKLNVDENPAISERYGIMSIPTLKIFKAGQIVEDMIGAQPEMVLRDKIKYYTSA